MSNLLGPLLYRDFRLFLTGHFISFTGSWIQTTALHWLIYDLNKSSSELGLYSLLTGLPGVAFTLFAGFLIDRISTKRLIQLVLVLSLIPPLIFIALIEMEKFNFWLFLIPGLIASFLSSIDMPTRQVLIGEIVPPRYLTQALSLQAFSFNSARMFGPLIAGVILAHSLVLCFWVNIISYLPFIIFTFMMKGGESPKGKQKRLTFNKEINAFFQFLLSKREILLLLLLVALFTVLATSIIILLPMIVHKHLNGYSKDFALLSSAVGIGAITGALIVFISRKPDSEIWQILKAHLLWTLGIMGLIFSKSFPIYFISLILIGMAFTHFYPVANAMIQRRSNSEHKGKVMSLFTVAFIGTAPLGQFFIGLLSEIIELKRLLLLVCLFLLVINLSIINILRKREKIYVP